MKRISFLLLTAVMIFTLAGCKGSSGEQTTSGKEDQESQGQSHEGSTLVYGSNDYTRINPAMDEHGEINILIFNGLTAHDGENEVIPALAKSWDFDEETYTYTFHLEENVKWHDGEPFTAEAV